MAILASFLPRLLATITRHPRQQVIAGVDFQWSKDSYVHNIFRVFELIFGRKSGIRREASAKAWKDEGGVTHEGHAFYTVEAFLKFVEHKIRNSFNLGEIRVHVPVFATPSGFPVFASPYLFAISLNSSGANHGSGTSISITSFSAATTNGLIFAVVDMNASANWSSVTCTDGSFTVIDTNQNGSHADNNVADYYILGTTTASQTLTANSGSGSHVLSFCAESLSGVKQSAQPDSHATNGASTGSTFSVTTVTVADNSWVAGGTFNGNITGGAVSAGAGTVVRQSDGGALGLALVDANMTITPAGSYSLNVTKTGNDVWTGVIASFAPAVATANGSFLAFM